MDKRIIACTICRLEVDKELYLTWNRRERTEFHIFETCPDCVRKFEQEWVDEAEAKAERLRGLYEGEEEEGE